MFVVARLTKLPRRARERVAVTNRFDIKVASVVLMRGKLVTQARN